MRRVQCFGTRAQYNLKSAEIRLLRVGRCGGPARAGGRESLCRLVTRDRDSDRGLPRGHGRLETLASGFLPAGRIFNPPGRQIFSLRDGYGGKKAQSPRREKEREGEGEARLEGEGEGDEY
jgi:hypothetical protein